MSRVPSEPIDALLSRTFQPCEVGARLGAGSPRALRTRRRTHGGAVFTYSAGAPITLRGWALDNAPGTTIRAEIDGVTLATLSPQGSRPDVCKVYPGYPTCPNVGFEGSIPTNSLDDCAHLLRVVATDANGNERVQGERVIAPN